MPVATKSSGAAKRRDEALRNSIPRKFFTDKTGYPGFRGSDKLGVWNLYRDGCTSTFLDTFNDCYEQARLAYVEGWQSHTNPIYIEFGSCVHDILHNVYRAWWENKLDAGIFGKDDSTSLESLVIEEVDRYQRKWNSLNEAPTPTQLQDMELVYGWSEAVLPAYLRRWNGDFTGKYTNLVNPSAHPTEFLSLEEEFKVPYVYPDGVTIWLRGKRDFAYRDKTKKKRILDTKCLGVIKDDEIIDMFPHDLQQMMYLLADLTETGEMAAGSVKNVIRRPGQRRSKKGGVEEPLENFMARIKAEYDDADNWDMKDEKTTGCFVRFEMTISEKELLDWKERTFDPMMQHLRDWVDGKTPHFARHKHAVTKYGPAGMYQPIIKGNYDLLTRRERPFPELAA